MTFLSTILAAAIGQILVLVIVQGFSNSYFGHNSKEEVSRFFDKLSKHVQKQKKPKVIPPVFHDPLDHDHY